MAQPLCLHCSGPQFPISHREQGPLGCSTEHKGARAPMSLNPWPSRRSEGMGLLELVVTWALPAWASPPPGEGAWDTRRHRILAPILPPGISLWLLGSGEHPSC